MMDTILLKEQYKIVRVLELQEHFAAVHAVDITSRSNDQCIINIYDGELLKPYIGYYSGLVNFAGYKGMFVRDESLAAVFSFRDGEEIDRVFFRGNKVKSSECIDYADQLFKLTLSVSDQPPEIICPLLLSRQLRFVKAEKGFVFHAVVVPTEGMNQREMALLLRDQILKLLCVKFDTVWAVRCYVRELKHAEVRSVVQLYTRWCEVRKSMKREAEKLDSSGFVNRVVHLLWLNIKDVYYNLADNRKAGGQ